MKTVKREKTGGRKKGTPNKLTSELRNDLKDIIENELKDIPNILKELPPYEKLQILIKLMPFVFPKLNSINYDINQVEIDKNQIERNKEFIDFM